MATLKSKKPPFIFGLKTKVIEDYIKFAEENHLTNLNITEHGVDIIIKREERKKEGPFHIIPTTFENEAPKEQLNLDFKATEETKQEMKISEQNVAQKYHQIKAPFVGTFYRRPSPDTEPFVKEGDSVIQGQTLCILEAMKVMNKINSDIKGKIVKIPAEDMSPIKKDDILFLIEPSA